MTITSVFPPEATVAPQPDWSRLEGVARNLFASNPLAATIARATPAGGYAAVALRPALSDVLSTR